MQFEKILKLYRNVVITCQAGISSRNKAPYNVRFTMQASRLLLGLAFSSISRRHCQPCSSDEVKGRYSSNSEIKIWEASVELKADKICWIFDFASSIIFFDWTSQGCMEHPSRKASDSDSTKVLDFLRLESLILIFSKDFNSQYWDRRSLARLWKLLDANLDFSSHGKSWSFPNQSLHS